LRDVEARPVQVAILLLVAALAAAGPPPSVDPSQIPAYRLLGEGLAVAGQPSDEALARLGEMGFRTVVNLRTEKEGAAGQRAVVEAQGLRYVWIPVTPESFSLADVEAVEGVLADSAAAPVLLHCSSSNRVGAVWAVIQARKGKDPDAAVAAGRGAGLHSPPMEEAVRRVLGSPGPSAEAPANP
jgi:uncharacterized protein (TIGR01244 family)